MACVMTREEHARARCGQDSQIRMLPPQAPRCPRAGGSERTLAASRLPSPPLLRLAAAGVRRREIQPANEDGGGGAPHLGDVPPPARGRRCGASKAEGRRFTGGSGTALLGSGPPTARSGGACSDPGSTRRGDVVRREAVEGTAARAGGRRG